MHIDINSKLPWGFRVSTANRPTLSDVAKLAGVSVATASRALSNPDLVAEGTRHAVRDAAQSCGYKVNLVARSLRMQRTNTILVLAPCIDNPFYPGLLRGIEDAAHDRGYLGHRRLHAETA